MEANNEAGKQPDNKDEDVMINFHSSNNFKYMRKYSKGKVPAEGGDVGQTIAAKIWPPLPNSPPPDSPPPLAVPIKLEDMTSTAEEDVEENIKKPVMCREYLRGNCTRGVACIYAHKVILSQLHGIYKFCRDFQNNKCNFQPCQFAHATVFEKECFYRTGFLPPHAIAHLEQRSGPVHRYQNSGPVPSPALPPTHQRPVVDAAGAHELASFPSAPQCSKCEHTNLRRQSQIHNAKELESSIQSLDNAIQQLDERNARQTAALLWLLENSSVAESGSQPSKKLRIKKDKEENQLTELVCPVLNRAEEVTLEYFQLTSSSEDVDPKSRPTLLQWRHRCLAARP